MFILTLYYDILMEKEYKFIYMSMIRTLNPIHVISFNMIIVYIIIY